MNFDKSNEVPNEYEDIYVEARETLETNNELWSLLAMGLPPEVLELILEHEGYNFEELQTGKDQLAQYEVVENGQNKTLETRKMFGFWRVANLR